VARRDADRRLLRTSTTAKGRAAPPLSRGATSAVAALTTLGGRYCGADHPLYEPGPGAQATAALPSVSGNGGVSGAPAHPSFTPKHGWTHDPQGLTRQLRQPGAEGCRQLTARLRRMRGPPPETWIGTSRPVAYCGPAGRGLLFSPAANLSPAAWSPWEARPALF
jgi:hypothetical protein